MTREELARSARFVARMTAWGLAGAFVAAEIVCTWRDFREDRPEWDRL